jgi:hypothetical protein
VDDEASEKPVLLFGRLLEQEQAPIVEVATVAAAPPPSSATEVKKSKLLSMAEVRKHNREEDAWIVVKKGKVYDCTEFLDLHPGGADSILINTPARIPPKTLSPSTLPRRPRCLTSSTSATSIRRLSTMPRRSS